MANRGYNLEFRMYMEGMLTPFTNATIVCTPNGVEANINIHACREALELKPKTAVQIFYKDWIDPPDGGVTGWRLLFDGFLSAYQTTESATGGRGFGILCRDFRMDIRKAPAALAWEAANSIGVQTHYNAAGLMQTVAISGTTPEAVGKQTNAGSPIHTFGNSGIDDFGAMIQRIAGAAAGIGMTDNAATSDPNDYTYTKKFGTDTPLQVDKKGKVESGLFLDAAIRGMWMQAAGGTSAGIFMNRRIRMDKRFLIPKNQTGYNFWSRQAFDLQVGSYLMGNSRFSSLEAAIMRLAGTFSCRVYSCSTPPLIPLDDKVGDKENPAIKYVIMEQVRKFLVERTGSEFGAKYMIGETMLLPPFEFTAPPNCNLFFPSMYDSVNWTYDTDADFTRGIFTEVNELSAPGSPDLTDQLIQVPNALFHIMSTEGSAADKYGRSKPPMTLEERYKGVNPLYGSVEYHLAADDATASARGDKLSTEARAILQERIRELNNTIDETNGLLSPSVIKGGGFSDEELELVRDELKAQTAARDKEKTRVEASTKIDTNVAMKHHAVIKYLNSKYGGRVVSIEMHFNPFAICGFPGAIISDLNMKEGDFFKNIIGMVQQVRHTIAIETNGAEAATSIVMNNVRFEDEPTDMDKFGYPLYMKPTDTEAARIYSDTLEYAAVEGYFPPDPVSPVSKDLSNEVYDLDSKTAPSGYPYAKDMLTLSESDALSGVRNNIYLDYEYIPTRIMGFYRDVLRQLSESFMVGTAVDSMGDQYKFVYDTMHEALSKLKTVRNDCMSDYKEAIKFVWRDVCSADAFFHGILGLSIETSGNKFINKVDNFDPSDIRDEYFGVTTELYESAEMSPYKPENNGLLEKAGDMSSIYEHAPLTAFIMERKDAVKRYLSVVQQNARSNRRTE